MSLLPGMVFISCPQVAEAGGKIVPGGQRARRSPAPAGGAVHGSGASGGLGMAPDRPGDLWGGVTCVFLEDMCDSSARGMREWI